MTTHHYPLLERIDRPHDLRQLSETQLVELATELRHFLIQTVSLTGGHLSAGLGTIELTIALHYVFSTPEDRLVWDVGHQSYPHKILTGRREQMSTLRQKGGLAGFPKRDESPYDTFGVGHSSTSIGAALGMAIAARVNNSRQKSVAIIGDGAMGAGMAFEALNHAGDLDANLLVVLNDNEMSISPNVGGMSNYLARVLSGKFYSSVRKSSKKVLAKRMPSVWELARRAEEHVKGMVVPGTLFEELGFNYIGPIDGHDIPTLITTLRNMRDFDGPQFLHVVTRKGKGFSPAEDNPCAFHGVGRFDPETGDALATPGATTYTEVFGNWLCDMAEQVPRLIAITPAMREGSGMVDYSERFPERYIDVGIAEQHAVTLAAGIACEGMKPVVAIYSSFLQRAYDQLIHDVALQNLPILFAIDRAGLVGPDGPTHAGSFDISFLRCVPNMLIMAPADENECRQMLYTGFMHDGPAAVRYPRGSGPGVTPEKLMSRLIIGQSEPRRQGQRIALLVFGSLLENALEVAETLDATVINMRFIKPLDESALQQLASEYALLVTLEENSLAGGAGEAVGHYLNTLPQRPELLQLGLPDRFIDHGSRDELLAECGLDCAGISTSIYGHLKMVGIELTTPQLNAL